MENTQHNTSQKIDVLIESFSKIDLMFNEYFEKAKPINYIPESILGIFNPEK